MHANYLFLTTEPRHEARPRVRAHIIPTQMIPTVAPARDLEAAPEVVATVVVVTTVIAAMIGDTKRCRGV